MGVGSPSYARNQYGASATELGSEAHAIAVLEVGDKIWVEGLLRVSATTTESFTLDGDQSVISLVKADGAGPAGATGAGVGSGRPASRA